MIDRTLRLAFLLAAPLSLSGCSCWSDEYHIEWDGSWRQEYVVYKKGCLLLPNRMLGSASTEAGARQILKDRRANPTRIIAP